MRHYLLTLLLATSATGAFALSDDFVKLDLSGAIATQSHESTTANIKPDNALDGNRQGGMAGWDNRELKKSDGTAADANTLDAGANWWAIDMTEVQSVDAMQIAFEGAFSTNFDIDFYTNATDAAPAETVNVTNNGTAFEYVFDNTKKYRYMRLNFLGATNHTWGIKFFEVELFRNIIKDGAAAVALKGDNTGSATVVKGRETTLTALII